MQTEILQKIPHTPMTILFDKTLLKFILVGILNTLLGAVIMFSLYNIAGCGYWFSSAANYTLVSIASFFLNKYYTFSNRNNGLRQFMLFATNIALCYAVAYTLAEFAVSFLIIRFGQVIADNMAMGIGLFLFTACNYLGQKLIVFRR